MVKNFITKNMNNLRMPAGICDKSAASVAGQWRAFATLSKMHICVFVFTWSSLERSVKNFILSFLWDRRVKLVHAIPKIIRILHSTLIRMTIFCSSYSQEYKIFTIRSDKNDNSSNFLFYVFPKMSNFHTPLW